MRFLVMVSGALALAGCGAADTAAKSETTTAAKLGAGLYEASAEVTSLASTDKTKPATKLAIGGKATAQGCVGADGIPAPALLGEDGDKCTTQSSYVRNGRMSVQLGCKRAGDAGNVGVTADGKFTADGFEADAETITGFSGEGDYRMARKILARRIGACPASAPKPA